MDIGRNALFFNDYIVAIGYFNRVIEVRPTQADPYFWRSYAKLMLDDLSGAEKDASQAISYNAFLTRAYLIRGIARQGQKQYREAVEDYKVALANMPDDAAIRFNMALSFRALEEYNTADSIAASLPKSFKSYPTALVLRADIALCRQDTPQAFEHINHAIEASDSTLFQAFLMKGSLLLTQNKYEEAISSYNLAERTEGAKEELYINRGLARYRQGDLSGALTDYNRAIELAPDNTLARFNRAQLLGYVGDNNNALKDFNEVLKADPNNYLALFNAGRISLELGRYKEALASFNKVLNRYPNFMVGLLSRAETKRRIGDAAGADYDEWRAYKLQKENKKRSAAPSSAADTTRSEEEETIEAYGKLMASSTSPRLDSQVTLPESLRGRIQDTESVVQAMPMLSFTFYPRIKQYTHQRYSAAVAVYNERIKPPHRLTTLALVMPLDSLELRDAEYQLMTLESQPHKSADWYFSVALYKHLLADIEGSLTYLDNALKLNPRHIPSRMLRASVAYRKISLNNNRFGATEGDRHNKESNSLTALPNSSRLTNSYESIVKDLTYALQQVPNDAVLLYNMGVISEVMGQKEEAIRYYKEAIQAPQAPPEAYYNIGLLYLSIGKRKEAIASLSKAGEQGIYEAYAILKRIQ